MVRFVLLGATFGSATSLTYSDAIDLYGKGYSEAPHVPSDGTLFVTQLALLMQYVRWETAHIVGFSMVRTHGVLSTVWTRLTHDK